MADSEDDAWVEQLREALASTANGGDDEPDADASTDEGPDSSGLTAHPSPTAQPAGDAGSVVGADQAAAEAPEFGPLLDAIASLGDRINALESATHELARDSRRSMAPDINQIEAALTRVLRAELPAILDARMSSPTALGLPTAEASLDQWAERVDLGDASTGEVVVLIEELRRRIVELEQLHRRALDELTDDRRQLIDQAVGEIRKLLFGE